MAPQLVAVGCTSFFFSSYFLSPDLDLKYSKPTQNWGIFRFFWSGYHRVFHHRGKSHSFLFSSCTKLVYLGLLTLFLIFFGDLLFEILSQNKLETAFEHGLKTLSKIIHLSYKTLLEHKNYAIAAAAGLVASDWVHILLDRVHSAIKRMR